MPAESTQVPPVSATFLVGVCKLDVLLVLLSLTLRGGLLLLLLIDRTGCARSCSAGEVLGAGQNWRVQQGRCPTKTAAAVARLELLTDRLVLIELDWLACRARVVSVTRWWVAAMRRIIAKDGEKIGGGTHLELLLTFLDFNLDFDFFRVVDRRPRGMFCFCG
jgi:hypothetical protein